VFPPRAIEIVVRPGAGRDEVAGEHDGALVVRLSAPALEGRANRALRKLVAKRLGVAPSRVEIVRGERSRRKLVRVEGVDPEAVRRGLAG
jgi:uncharacterized protein (TIGR00251 family)